MTGHRKRVLVIDDEPAICDLLKAMLEPDYDVDVRQNALAGLRAAQTSPPDLIIYDEQMSGLFGEELEAWLKFTDATADVPVLRMRSEPSFGLKDLVQNEAFGVLRKPFCVRQLHKAIGSALAVEVAESSDSRQAA